VAVQHCHSGKFNLLILSKLVAVKKSVFTSSHVLLQYNSSIFWGAMKRYLREPAENIPNPNAMDSVDVLSSWKLEHQMIQWMVLIGMGRVQYR